ITLEANPTSVEAGRFRGYAAAGVNRLSMGVQSLRDADLRALGRMHTAAEARAAFDVARNCFGRVSFDLIYARQGQDMTGWRAELAEALAMAVDHLSLYQLTIEPGTRFGELAARGRLRGLPSEGLGADLFQATREICAAAGMPAYEISNHARPGLESRHNLIYWRYGDYVGIGPGAHGRITHGGRRWAVEAVTRPEAWLEAVESGADSTTREEVLPDAQSDEMMLMGLRLAEGVSLARFEALAGRPLTLAPDLLDFGLVEIEAGRIRATAKGVPLLDAVLKNRCPGSLPAASAPGGGQASNG
ncbi:coproporphyrinogen III oxidase, partial [Amaricoccus sp. HAR-UPW-R2A-40]